MEESEITSRVLFSGRFDPVHPGHIATIIRLCDEFGMVKVIILDDDSRAYPVEYIREILKECLQKYMAIILTNKTHFGEITKKELDSYGCTHYAAGNLPVLRHVEKLGMEVIYVERAYDYSARDYKRLD